MGYVQLNLRISAELGFDFDAEIKKSGLTKTEVVKTLIAEWVAARAAGALDAEASS